MNEASSSANASGKFLINIKFLQKLRCKNFLFPFSGGEGERGKLFARFSELEENSWALKSSQATGIIFNYHEGAETLSDRWSFGQLGLRSSLQNFFQPLWAGKTFRLTNDVKIP